MYTIYEVYKITNILNNKVYIGITSNGAETRFKQHVSKANSGSQYPFHKAILEDGFENFKVETIETQLDKDVLREREKYFIKLFNSTDEKFGYNTTGGGEYLIITEAMREAMSASQRGSSKPRLHKGVLQYSHEGVFIKEYSSMTDAEKETNISRASILRILNKTVKRGSKQNPYLWLWSKDYEEIPTKINPESIYTDINFKSKQSEACIKARDYYKTTTGNLLELSKSVSKYNTKGEFIQKYHSIREAARQNNMSPEAIRLHLRGKYDYTNEKILKKINFIWKE